MTTPAQMLSLEERAALAKAIHGTDEARRRRDRLESELEQAEKDVHTFSQEEIRLQELIYDRIKARRAVSIPFSVSGSSVSW